MKQSIFNVHDNGIIWIFLHRVELSPLKRHKKAHKFAECEEPRSGNCSCSMGIAEAMGRFLVHCPNVTIHRRTLFGTVNIILQIPFCIRSLQVNNPYSSNFSQINSSRIL